MIDEFVQSSLLSSFKFSVSFLCHAVRKKHPLVVFVHVFMDLLGVVLQRGGSRSLQQGPTLSISQCFHAIFNF